MDIHDIEIRMRYELDEIEENIAHLDRMKDLVTELINEYNKMHYVKKVELKTFKSEDSTQQKQPFPESC